MDDGMEDGGAAAEQPVKDRMNCARSLPLEPQSVGWDAILPKRGSSMDTHFNDICELGLGDASLSGEDEKRKWLEKKYREHFVLKGGGCNRRAGGTASGANNSFHVKYVDPHGHGRTCCDGPNNLRKWMLVCLKRSRSLSSAPRAAAGLASLTPALKTAILAGVGQVVGILDAGGPDSNLTSVLGKLLREDELDIEVEKCFLGDGKWDQSKGRFEEAPDWESVRKALAILKTTTNGTVLALSPHAMYVCPPPMICMSRPHASHSSACPTCICVSPQCSRASLGLSQRCLLMQTAHYLAHRSLRPRRSANLRCPKAGRQARPGGPPTGGGRQGSGGSSGLWSTSCRCWRSGSTSSRSPAAETVSAPTRIPCLTSLIEPLPKSFPAPTLPCLPSFLAFLHPFLPACLP